jgi:hypothetical protein
MIHPILSKTYRPLEEAGEGAYEMHHNLHTGKIGILVGGPEEGLGVQNEALRTTPSRAGTYSTRSRGRRRRATRRRRAVPR